MKPEPHDYVPVDGLYCGQTGCGLPRANVVHSTEAERVFGLRCHEAGLGVMQHLLGVILDREVFTPESLLSVARTIDVQKAYEACIVPSLDALEDHLSALGAAYIDND